MQHNLSMRVLVRHISLSRGTLPLQVGWYNALLPSSLHLDYPESTLAVVVLSTPDMFEQAFLPFLENRLFQRLSDPVDQCVKHCIACAVSQVWINNKEMILYVNKAVYGIPRHIWCFSICTTPLGFPITKGGCQVWLWAATQQKAQVLSPDCCSRIWCCILLPTVRCQRSTLGWQGDPIHLFAQKTFTLISDLCAMYFPAENVWGLCAPEVRWLVCHQSSAGVWRCDDWLWDAAASPYRLCLIQRGKDPVAGGFQF